jgi:hypothetical protein
MVSSKLREYILLEIVLYSSANYMCNLDLAILMLAAPKPNDISVWTMEVGIFGIPFTGYCELHIFLPPPKNLT